MHTLFVRSASSYALRAARSAVNLFHRLGLALVLLAALSATPAQALIPTPTDCQNDVNGANDQPGQKDVTRYCIGTGDGAPWELLALYNWDETTLTGNNTADICSLYNTDADTFVNLAVCVTLKSSGAGNGNLAILKEVRLLSCTDTKTDRCTGPTLLAGPYTTQCEVSQQNTDPFSPAVPNGPGDQYPVDTQILCGVDLNDFGLVGASARLLDACSYPSTIPNSDPSDCISYRTCTATSQCDDGNPCTIDTCDATAGACTHTPTPGASCDNGLYCDGTETCDSLGFCSVSTPRNCDDGLACTIDSCDELNDTCINDPRDSLCNDGQFCNGVETCDVTNGCVAGVVPNCNDNVSCTADSCNEATDSCNHVPSNAACDDGQYCDGLETCDVTNGCQPGSAPNCDDGVSCTTDACNEATDSCSHTASNAACSDGQFCNGIETCNATLGCQSGTPPNCNDAVACTSDSCNEASDQCDHLPSNAACSDGQYCNGSEICDPLNGCGAGLAPDCNDGVSCTTDACNEATDSCSHTPSNGACSDGQFCNGIETCDVTNDCQPGSPPNCDDGVSCTTDACNEATDSCSHTASNAACSDGQFCNGNETCNATLGCQAGSPPNCNDGVSCTSDSCNETTDQCDNVANNDACSDGQFCTGVEICDPQAGCQGGTDPCPGILCNESANQCVQCLTDANCDNGVFCDGAETCNTGTGLCQPGTPPSCNDGVACTVDTCDETADACDHSPTNALCSDGQYCNGAETCNATLGCQAGAPPNCNDGVFCTTDACNETTDSCNHTPNNGACNDAQYCNGVETCSATLGCQAGIAPDCDDGVSCTTDACDEASDACTHAASNAACSDGQFCNGAEVCDPVNDCKSGTAPSCNDAVSCTVDSCNEITDQCDNIPNNSVCDDGQFCDGPEVCNPSLGCTAGTAPSCADGVACTTDTCNETTDGCDHAASDAACDDGQYCNGAETCDASVGCKGGTPPSCADGTACSTDTCDESTDSCKHDMSTCVCGDGEVTAPEACDPPALAGTFEDCNNLVDDDGDGKADCRDPDCAPSARGPICDDQCTMDEVCAKFIKDPALITFRWDGKPDTLWLHGRFPLEDIPDPLTEPMVFQLSNERGPVYRAVLGWGDFTGRSGGRRWRYTDPAAPTLGDGSPSGGLYRVGLILRSVNGVPYLSFKVQVYGDLSLATERVMTAQLSVGAQVGSLTAEWTALPARWKLVQAEY